MTALLIATTALLRTWVRAANRNLGWDDWNIILAGATAIARFGFIFKQAQHGNGRHRVYLSDYQYRMINMLGWGTDAADTKTLRILLYVVMAGIVITNFGVVIILIAERQPAGFWGGKSAKCWPAQIRIYSIYATIAYSVLTDLVCSLLPLAVGVLPDGAGFCC
ncbi:hypothetical protein C8034_v008096 [Colletotrichum sidae]|uniref:Uncharacterized protein n=1 Tax=Colletotrichum sidae TaxID=1347389 RepID=A0A4R8TP65_9PEZI|nr:hypothetical protein C8034_v008096 [Colletotrichum sidae]